MTYYLSDENEKKFQKQEELFTELKAIEVEYFNIQKAYYENTASEDEVIELRQKLINTNKEWLNSLILFRKESK